MAYGQGAADACAPDAPERPTALFAHGFVLLLHRAFADAQSRLQEGAALARRAGDVPQEARCTTYLAVAARMRGMLAETETFTARALETSTAAGMQEYVAAAQANQAWLALARGDSDQCEQLARRALDAWKNLPQLVFPFQWLANVPLLRALLARGELDAAAACACALLAPSQQLLPDSSTAALTAVRTLAVGPDTSATRSGLERATALLTADGYH